MPRITTLPDVRGIDASTTETILEALQSADIPITYACGGNAYCSTCRITVLSGIEHCSEPTEAEKTLIGRLKLPAYVRLACQTKISGDISIRRLVVDYEDIDLIDSQFATEATGVEQSFVMIQAAIRGATNFDEVNFPYDILYVMSRYFQRMQQIISSYGGRINNFMGGRFLALFPADQDDAAARAVWAALEMLTSVENLNEFLEQLSYRPLNLSLGIHSGSAIAVPLNPGQPNGDFLPLGDVTSVVSRIENYNAALNSQLAISEVVYAAVKDRVVILRTGSIEVSAKGTQMSVYQAIAMKGDAPVKAIATVPGEEMTFSKRILSFIQKFRIGISK
ncbi:MAG: 2Fe-2S iron-sulfur cluster binding domain-containing protein [Chloroflexaceae bacterium]|nr:2Fe-2S iron-sulfur cluster binding domain-containing protein [Chloroflexaceae bacterium]